MHSNISAMQKEQGLFYIALFILHVYDALCNSLYM